MLAFALVASNAEIGSASTTRMQAQTAADAAALAAVAEAAPYGGGRPEQVASEYARLNGGELVSCSCGTTRAEVEVEVDGVVARAAAAFDASSLAPAAVAFDRRGLHPFLESTIERLIAAAGGAVYVVSGHRSESEQRSLWTEALARYGSPERADDWVARPGRSMHERGLAVDLGGDIELAAKLVTELALPLARPLRHEPWHFELVFPGSSVRGR